MVVFSCLRGIRQRRAQESKENPRKKQKLSLSPVPRIQSLKNPTETYYVYMLLDPRVSGNIPYQMEQMRAAEGLEGYFHSRFVQSVFCVAVGKREGIGKMGMPGSVEECPPVRLLMAKKEFAAHHDVFEKERLPLDIAGVCDIWDAGYGVVLLADTLYTTEQAAAERVALLVETFNQISGARQAQRGGCNAERMLSNWKLLGSSESLASDHNIRTGKSLLKGLFRTLISQGERQIFPEEIDD